ncbi:MAG: DUF427 domain-containing protein [Gammaproteobacteria bacterium]
MVRAIWNGAVLAESDETEQVEGNYYFPPQAIQKEYFTGSDKTTHCHWKGDARYYNVTVDGKLNENAAWYYPDPKQEAAQIKDYVAFWKGVEVS